jgi:hypothetical protein
MEEKKKELNSILIGLLFELEVPKTRIMLIMATIAAYQLQQTMIDWAVDYYEREGTITTQAFMSKLNALTTPNN